MKYTYTSFCDMNLLSHAALAYGNSAPQAYRTPHKPLQYKSAPQVHTASYQQTDRSYGKYKSFESKYNKDYGNYVNSYDEKPSYGSHENMYGHKSYNRKNHQDEETGYHPNKPASVSFTYSGPSYRPAPEVSGYNKGQRQLYDSQYKPSKPGYASSHPKYEQDYGGKSTYKPPSYTPIKPYYEPSYEPDPTYEPSDRHRPVYEPKPTYKPKVTYEPKPTYESKPYHQKTTYEPKPAYESRSKYDYGRYNQKLTYKPNYDVSPTYPDYRFREEKREHNPFHNVFPDVFANTDRYYNGAH